MKISDNFKSMHITATQMILQKGYLYNHWIVSAKDFKAIVLVVMPVGVAKN